jgi:arginyl-tRNA synthetase
MDVREEIKDLIKKALGELEVQVDDFSVERPKETNNGDYSTNIAFVGFKIQDLGFRNPREFAEKIVGILNSKFLIHDSNFDKVEIAGPGFINFYLSNQYLQKQVVEIIKAGEKYGSIDIGKGQNVSVEYVSANPTGPLHIGNARGGPIGDVLANVLQKAGYSVTKEYLHNNVGGQVQRLGETIYFTLHPDQKSENYEMQYLGEYIKELSKMVEEEMEGDNQDLSQEQFVEKAGQIAVEIMLSEILKDCELMGIRFDKIVSESELKKEAQKAISGLKDVKEKDGALWFAPNDEFLEDRETVVRKSDGEYTYFASDIVYHQQKFQTNNLVIDVWGSNHSGHVPRMKAAIKALGFNADNFKAILYQFVRIKRRENVVKMSKRAGNFVTAREVLDEVGKDAFRFFMLMHRAETHMDFDLELAKKKASENPVFYVQYAYARISSIFMRVHSSEFRAQDLSGADLSLLTSPEEVAVIRHLLKLPELIQEIAKSFNVNSLTSYAMEIASLFHHFYEKHTVISENKELTLARLALLKATQIALKNTLDLLGVSAPEKM